MQVVGTMWDKFLSNSEVTINRSQAPVGVPSDFKAISEGRIIAGQVLGVIHIYGSAINPQYIARNSRRINNLWNNQQRFLNYTVLILEGTHAQLNATSSMALQNRFILDIMMLQNKGCGTL